MTEEILPNEADVDNHPTTSLEAAHAQALENAENAEKILAQAKEDGADPERIAQLEHLQQVARDDLERTRKAL